MTSSTPSFSWFSWLAPLPIAFFCWWLWWWELVQVVPSGAMAWARYDWQSIYPIIVLIVGVFLWPLHRAFGMPWPWVFLYGVLLSVVSATAYWRVRSIFQELYLEGLLSSDHSLVAWSIWKLLALAFVLALFYFLPLWHYHTTTDGMHILTLLEVFILVIPCSLITLECFPMGSTEISFMNAVRLGYPVFWTTIGLGYLSRGIAEEWL